MTENHKVIINRELESSDPLAPARGVVMGVLLVALFYLVVGLIVWVASMFVL